jgi:rhamnose transport system ATP-binding protein
MDAPLLQLTSVAKSFGAVRALKGVSFDLKAGEVHALLGENGAGKSTLIKVITGAHQPDSGSIEINGEHVAHLTPASARKLGIACIYQQPALFPDLTVAENIGLRLESPKNFKRVHWSARRDRRKNFCNALARTFRPMPKSVRFQCRNSSLSKSPARSVRVRASSSWMSRRRR